jgi:hypothetical protein
VPPDSDKLEEDRARAGEGEGGFDIIGVLGESVRGVEIAGIEVDGGRAAAAVVLGLGEDVGGGSKGEIIVGFGTSGGFKGAATEYKGSRVMAGADAEGAIGVFAGVSSVSDGKLLSCFKAVEEAGSSFCVVDVSLAGVLSIEASGGRDCFGNMGRGPKGFRRGGVSSFDAEIKASKGSTDDPVGNTGFVDDLTGAADARKDSLRGDVGDLRRYSREKASAFGEGLDATGGIVGAVSTRGGVGDCGGEKDSCCGDFTGSDANPVLSWGSS